MHIISGMKQAFLDSIYLLILVIMFGLVGVTPAMAQDQNGLHWEWCNPLPTGNRLEAVDYGAGQIVAVGNCGTILTSPDGNDWTEQVSGTTNDLNDILWTGSQFIAVGYVGDILTSPDGKIWTKQNTGTTASVCCVAWDGSKYVAGCDGGVVLTSNNGVNWVASPSNTKVLPKRMVYGGGKFVAVGVWGEVMTSANGTAWTMITLPEGENIYGLTWDGNQFVAASYSSIYTSPDGAAWTRRIANVNGLFCIAWNGGKFVALGRQGLMVTSPNGTDWTQLAVEIVGNDSVYDVIWDGTQFVAVGGSGTIITSIDGTSWIPHCTTITKSGLRDAAYGNDQFTIVGLGGTIITSADRNNLNLRTSGTPKNLDGIVYGGNRFVAVGDYGTILTSPDGNIWTIQSSGTTDNLASVAWDGHEFVAVGGNGTILTSANGTIWSKQNFGTEFLKDVVWGGNQFVAVGLSGTILISPDGSNWTQVSPGISRWLWGVAWNGSKFVAVGDRGTVLTSPDGITWTTHDSVLPYGDFQDVTWYNNQFIAVGTFGFIATSPDGNVWTSKRLANELRGVATNGAQVIALGDSGTILTVDTTFISNFAIRFYQLCLDRAPDKGGLDYWVEKLVSGQQTGADIAVSFILSPEFINRGLTDSAFLDVMYGTFFDRAADAGGKTYWQGQMNGGMSRPLVLANFVGSPEFTDICAQYGIVKGNIDPDVTAFVIRFFQLCLERDPEPAGLLYWTDQLLTGQKTGADIALGFIFSQEFTARGLSDSAFLDVMYGTFFGRAADAGGKAYWSEQMSGGMSRLVTMANFVNSAEFAAICSDYGIVRGSVSL